MMLATCVYQSAYASTDEQAASSQQEPPTMAFLEYLAELEQVDGEWVSALDVAEGKEPTANDKVKHQVTLTEDNSLNEQGDAQ
ncbi:hypothetical protein GCM10011369_07440 [Neiella marina]|uniref:Uncharacterized protein n=1 Tax=Neiella marina TaxID=508461 RepID=A0A8J2XLD0_9GAMM|nr:hypothetical protein [Neiella marina]GGA68316.1 hypothetical protein GCM10011369_07440 [Neiella marina]